MDGGHLIDLLEHAGYNARRYSGRAMYGATCVGVDLDHPGKLFRLGLLLGAAAVEKNADEYVGTDPEDLPRPVTDNMGRGIIAYWREVKWPEGREEVCTVWRCENCGSKNREVDEECADCGYSRRDG